MPEEQNVKGDQWTREAKGLLSRLGWRQGGDANVDIPCTKHHDRTNDHGIDLFFSYQDPFQRGKPVGVVVETKSRNWKGISTSTIQGFIGQVVKCLECAPLHPDFASKFNFEGPVNMGLILIWCNDVDEKGASTYDHAKFLEYLSELTLPLKRRDSAIFVASNREITRWVTLIRQLERLKADGFTDLEFFYPSIHDSVPTNHSQLSLTMMYSKYVFCRGTRVDKQYGFTVPTTVVFYFERPSYEELVFMYKALKRYQLLDDKRELHVFLDHGPLDSRNGIAEFVRQVQAEYAASGKQLQVNVGYMEATIEVPADWAKEA